MSSFTKRSPSRSPSRVWQWALLTISALFVPGCNGCWSTDPNAAKKAEEEEEEKKKKEEEEEEEKKKGKKKDEKKADFVLSNVLTQPEDQVSNRVPANYVRRGHWCATIQSVKANNFDFEAEYETQVADNARADWPGEQSEFATIYSRPVKLAKGQERPLDGLFLAPRQRLPQRAPGFLTRLNTSGGGTEVAHAFAPPTFLEEPEYLLVVLSPNPSKFLYLGQMDSARPPGWGDGLIDADFRSLRVLTPKIANRIPLAGDALLWTSISVIVWDNVDPTTLQPEQQRALVDWLHFGGQLIVNGPTSLATLRGSFLDPWLPVEPGQTTNMGREELKPLDAGWTIVPKQQTSNAKPRDLNLVRDRAVLGVELKLKPNGAFLKDCGELLAEGRVGRGRVVVSGFALGSEAIAQWRSFDNLFNACFLRRPRRLYFSPVQGYNGDNNQVSVGYPDLANLGDGTIGVGSRSALFSRDPRINSTMRYFTRDIGWLPGETVEQPLRIRPGGGPDDPAGETDKSAVATSLRHPAHREDLDDWRFAGHVAAPQSGVAGWNDFSGAADAARRSLREAAGIKVPKAEFVLWTLAGYLLVLVPLNWGIFRAIGRVEWAWIAAPIIAIGGGYTVIRLAELDIGFARSQTEIDIVETYAGYDRAHVTRYVAIYSSLESGYDLTFQDESALVQPMAVNSRYAPRETKPVRFRREDKLFLQGLRVISNSTQIVHAEQMLSLGGAIELTGDEASGWSIKNGTTLPLRDAIVVRRAENADDESYEAAWLGDLDAEAEKSLGFSADVLAPQQPENEVQPIPTAPDSRLDSRSDGDEDRERDTRPASRDTRVWPKNWAESPIFSEFDRPSAEGPKRVRLHRLARLAVRQLRLLPGEHRLVAWASRSVPGLTVSPTAAQGSEVAFVICHLRQAKLPDPRGDLNCRVDIDPKADDPNADDESQAMPGDPATPLDSLPEGEPPGEGT